MKTPSRNKPPPKPAGQSQDKQTDGIVVPPYGLHRASDAEKESCSEIDGNRKCYRRDVVRICSHINGYLDMSSISTAPPREVIRAGLRHHRNQDWAPSRKHDIANGVGYRVTQRRQFTLCLFLNSPKCGGDRPRSGTRA